MRNRLVRRPATSHHQPGGLAEASPPPSLVKQIRAQRLRSLTPLEHCAHNKIRASNLIPSGKYFGIASLVRVLASSGDFGSTGPIFSSYPAGVKPSSRFGLKPERYDNVVAF